MAFTLAPLPYPSDALEPHFDQTTMEIHHDRHHNTYVTNLNNAVAGTEMEGVSLEDLVKNISKYPAPIRNNGGGHWNHAASPFGSSRNLKQYNSGRTIPEDGDEWEAYDPQKFKDNYIRPEDT